MGEKIRRVAELPGPTPAPDFSTLAEPKPAPISSIATLGWPLGGHAMTAATVPLPDGTVTIPASVIKRTGKPKVGQSVRCGLGETPNSWEQAAIILKVHDPLPGTTGWHCDLALLTKWQTSPAPTAVKGLSGAVIGHVETPVAPPPTGTTVMMTYAERIEDANDRVGSHYGWRYAD